ncbi:SRPBCC family protein [Nocardia speluncae]|uniref:SRPBCC family protein n=1 Tax=Nocardia speluncae TaxID=419477 RepID=A0A846X8D5_9NOCA|nr:SRPBCC family protein [Nocardia speluncae]NKY31695.1 SRPBCC family protein [Nocardia speluncae]
MHTTTVERTIAAPIGEVFDWFADSRNYARSPAVLRNRWGRLGDESPYGVGAVRIHLWVIGWFRERITAYNAPHGFDYFVERSFPPAHHEGGSMTFTEVPGGTRVIWSTTSELPLPFPTLRTAAMRVAGPVIAKVFDTILEAAEAALTEPPGSGN